MKVLWKILKYVKEILWKMSPTGQAPSSRKITPTHQAFFLFHFKLRWPILYINNIRIASYCPKINPYYFLLLKRVSLMGGPHQTVGIFKSSVIGVMNGIVKREYIHNIIIIAPNLSHRPLGFLEKMSYFSFFLPLLYIQKV